LGAAHTLDYGSHRSQFPGCAFRLQVETPERLGFPGWFDREKVDRGGGQPLGFGGVIVDLQ
jgi:hypothetical protein